MFKHTDRRSDRIGATAGFTLVELMIVVAIVAILAAIAVPAYTGYVTQANRSMAKGELVELADAQEQFRVNNGAYAAALTGLGFANDPTFIDADGRVVGGSSGDRIYSLTVSASTANTFTLQATPQLSQATEDSDCGSLTLDEQGNRGVTGSAAASDCW